MQDGISSVKRNGVWPPGRWSAALAVLLALSSLLTASVTGVWAAAPATPSAVATPIARGPSPGAPGIGDPYFPLLGNGGYDVAHYTLDLDLDVAEGSILKATATIDAIAAQDLSAFNFDYRGPQIDAVSVDGAPATWERNGGELTVTPAAPILDGASFETKIDYHGKPDGGDDHFVQGWWATGSSIFTVGEPSGADVWYPVNGHPLDKATYTLNITVPEPYNVVSNGRLASVAMTTGAGDNPATRTFTWENDEPTASYLVMFHAADLDVQRSKGSDGVSIVEALPPDLPQHQQRIIDKTPEILAYFTHLFGPYPFPSLGNTIFEDTSFNAALETQGMISYDRSSVTETTVAHEIAHQWFGDSVSLERWQDIWLNEGFARYAEYLWAEHAHGQDAADAFLRRQMSVMATVTRTPNGEGVLIGAPGADHLFSEVVYAGGALLLDDLRHQIGDDAFFRLLREWAQQHRYGNANTNDFIALAEQVSGQNLDAFFYDWLFTPWTPERVADRYSLNGTPVS
jgi:aminopeptidase N